MTNSTVILLIPLFLYASFQLNCHFIKNSNVGLNSFMIVIFSFLYIFIASLVIYVNNSNFDIIRFIGSYLLLIIFIAIAFYIAMVFKNLDDRKLYKYIKIVYFILLFDGIFSAITYSLTGSKIMLLFLEPSHFALSFLPIVLFIYIKNQKNFSILLLPISIALTIQNLTLLVGLLLFTFYQNKNYFVLKIIFILSVLVSFFSFYDSTYFMERLNFTEDVSNLSTLVFLSGWEESLLNIISTSGLGIGFNQLGILGETGLYRSALQDLNMPLLNIFDGGTTGSKLISELGVLGIILLLIYLRYIILSLKIIKMVALRDKDLLMLSFLLGAFFELFIRGVGYFTPTMFMLIMSIFYINVTFYGNEPEL